MTIVVVSDVVVRMMMVYVASVAGVTVVAIVIGWGWGMTLLHDKETSRAMWLADAANQ